MNLRLFREKNNNLAGKKKYEIFIFAILMFEFVVLCPSITNVNPWTFSYYYFSYQDLGFNSRFFIGSVFKIFSNYISTSALYLCIIVIIICVNAFVSVFLGNILRRCSRENVYSLEMFLILFLASPVSLSFLFIANNFGRLDMYLIVFTIVMILLLRDRILKWFIPFLSIIAIATHQGYLLTYMPVIIILLIYNIYKGKLQKRHLFLCLTTCLAGIASFVYFQFFTPELSFKNASDVVAFLSGRTDYVISSEVIYIEYFANVDTWFSTAIELLKNFALKYGLCMFVLTAPLITIFLTLWIIAYKTAGDKFSKFIVFLCAVAPVASLPLFIGNDWDRWIPAVFLTQFLLVFSFFDAEFKCVTKSAAKIYTFFHNHLMLFIVVVLYLSSFIFSDAIFLGLRLLAELSGFLNDTIASFQK